MFSQAESDELLQSKLDDIRTLYSLLKTKTKAKAASKRRKRSDSSACTAEGSAWRPPKTSKSDLVTFKFHAELDGVIDRLEELYYKYYIKNQPMKKLESQVEEDIAMSHKMKSLLPIAIALGMMTDTTAATTVDAAH